MCAHCLLCLRQSLCLFTSVHIKYTGVCVPGLALTHVCRLLFWSPFPRAARNQPLHTREPPYPEPGGLLGGAALGGGQVALPASPFLCLCSDPLWKPEFSTQTLTAHQEHNLVQALRWSQDTGQMGRPRCIQGGYRLAVSAHEMSSSQTCQPIPGMSQGVGRHREEAEDASESWKLDSLLSIV